MTDTERRCRNKKPKSEYRKPVTRRAVSDNDHLAEVGEILMAIMAAYGIPEFLHTRSNHIYTYRQKIALLALRADSHSSYRRMYRNTPSYRGFCKAVGIVHVPHHTTLCKFSSTVDRGHLELIVNAFSQMCGKGNTVAVDGTAFANYDRSAHYERRLKDFGAKIPKKTTTKASLAVDVQTKYVVACHVSPGLEGDATHVPFLVSQIKDSGLDVRYVVADKGYDSEAIHRSVKDELGATALIPVREVEPGRISRDEFRTKGSCRNSMKRILVKATPQMLEYMMRSIVETANSMIKKVKGSSLRSKKEASRGTEVFCRIISHNVDRVFELGHQFLVISL